MTTTQPGASAVRTIGVAIPIPSPWAAQLASRRAEAGDPQGRLIPPHLTLVGPTEITADRFADLDAHLRRVATTHPPFVLHLRGTGTFRPISPVVFVAVVAGISECERLERALRAGPLNRERQHPYHPHVTVAHDAAEVIGEERLDAVFKDLASFEARFTVPGFAVYEHGMDGRWRPQRSYALSGPRPPSGSTSAQPTRWV